MPAKRNIRRVVILNEKTLEPEIVFASYSLASIHFNTYHGKVYKMCVNAQSNNNWGYIFMWADEWEKENGEFLPGDSSRIELEFTDNSIKIK